jgi:hypothetical protein
VHSILRHLYANLNVAYPFTSIHDHAVCNETRFALAVPNACPAYRRRTRSTRARSDQCLQPGIEGDTGQVLLQELRDLLSHGGAVQSRGSGQPAGADRGPTGPDMEEQLRGHHGKAERCKAPQLTGPMHRRCEVEEEACRSERQRRTCRDACTVSITNAPAVPSSTY